jgi:hypothetical protein
MHRGSRELIYIPLDDSRSSYRDLESDCDLIFASLLDLYRPNVGYWMYGLPLELQTEGLDDDFF